MDTRLVSQWITDSALGVLGKEKASLEMPASLPGPGGHYMSAAFRSGGGRLLERGRGFNENFYRTPVGWPVLLVALIFFFLAWIFIELA